MERINEQNFKTLLKIIPGGQDYKIAANGKLMRKVWIGENGDGNPSNHGGRDGRGGRGGNNSRGSGRGRGRGRNTSMGGNQRMVTSGSRPSVRTESPTRSSVRDTFPSNRRRDTPPGDSPVVKRSRTTMEPKSPSSPNSNLPPPPLEMELATSE